MDNTIYSPSYHYVKYAEKINIKNGNENLGFLSFERGFMPLENPIKKLPPPFGIWDNIATNLPFHYKNQNLRSAIQQLPVLDASKKNLDDKYLCRASMLMSILAHAYVRCERKEDLNLPYSITKPWQTISERLKRPKPFLSYIDLIIYNWKFKNDSANTDGTLENLNLLTPTVNNQEEQVFYLTQTEIAFKTKEILQYVVAIQNAIVQNNKQEVINGLIKFKELISDVTESSFLKIDPNPRSKTYVDPVVWAKTVAPFAVPIKEGVQGPSGTSSPFFHLIDTFIERSKYDTILGKEALFIREWYPEHWQKFLTTVEQVSLIDFIKKNNDEALNGAFDAFLESYSGDQGFLGVHRRKVYGYLQMAFKVGRSVTIGGFSGLFKERTWEEVDTELEATRMERFHKKKLKCPYSAVISQAGNASKSSTTITLNTAKKGLSYRAGDRCSVVPKNTNEKVTEIISLLQLTGDETIVLNKKWKTYFQLYYNQEKESASLSELLFSSKLGNVNKVLHLCPHLNLFIKNENNDVVSFVDLLKKLSRFSPNVSKIILPHLMDFLEPEEERMYSIASGFNDKKIELLISNVDTKIDGKIYKGICSNFLTSKNTTKNTKIPLRIVRPLRFSLPKKIDTASIVLFAAGSGIAPFKAFLEELKKENRLENTTLFYSIKHVNDLIFKEELEDFFFNFEMDLQIIVTRDKLILNNELSKTQNKLIFTTTEKTKIDELLFQKNNSQKIHQLITNTGYFYTCGKAGFALTIINALREICLQLGSKNSQHSSENFYSLFAENRYMQDVFTSPECTKENIKNKFHLSDIIGKNNDKNGYWIAIDNKVYDVTEFKEIHPGGDKIIIDNTGRDGTHEFNKANHNNSKEIQSLLNAYCIGSVIDLPLPHHLKSLYNQWLDALHLCTEMLNTYIADFSFKEKSITELSIPKEITPFKIALVVENQNRFLVEYVKNINDILQALFIKHPSYKDTFKLFNKIIRVSNDIIDIVQLKDLTIEESWKKLLIQESKNKLILVLVRELLWDGIKIFEAHNNNSIETHSLAIENLFELFQNDLKYINERNEMSELLHQPI